MRWETDFGAAELTHLNLYDRTVEGLVLRDVAGCTVQYHPEAGPGPHDARYLFDRFLELAADDASRAQTALRRRSNGAVDRARGPTRRTDSHRRRPCSPPRVPSWLLAMVGRTGEQR